MKSVMVTGCAGFIGSHLTEKLVDTVRVIGVDSFSDYYDPMIKKRNIQSFVNTEAFQLHALDIRDRDKLRLLFEGNKIDTIVHLAANVGVRASIDNPLEYVEVNINGTLAVLDLAKEFGVKNIVFGSSSSVYGNADTPFLEESETNPISPYGATKLSGEALCKTYHNLYNLNVTCLRFFTVYGPRGRPDMAPFKFVSCISEGKRIPRYGDGSTKRDYTYVSDIVGGIHAAMDKTFGFEVVNLGNSNPVELNYFISLIEKSLGKKSQINQLEGQPGDVRDTCADITKAQQLLGWKPKISIEEGIEKFVAWFTENKKM